MKKILTFFAVLLAFGIQSAGAQSVVKTTFATDDSGLFKCKCEYYDDKTYNVTVYGIADYSLPKVKNIVFPATVHATFEKYDGTNDIEDDFAYDFVTYLFDGPEARETVETITFSEGIERIPDYFYDKGITEVTNMEAYMGSEATALKEIRFPASVTYIGDNAFRGHINLEKITFAEGSKLSVIGNEAFHAIYEKSMGGGGGMIDPGATITWHSALKTFELPASVTAIGDFAFKGHVLLKSITIPEPLTAIGDGAFESCGIEEVTLDKCLNLAVGTSSPFAGCPVKKVTIVPRKLTQLVAIVPAHLFESVYSQFDVEIQDRDKDFENVSFGEKCFYGSCIKSIQLPEKIVKSSTWTFSIAFENSSFANTRYFKTLDLASVECEDAVIVGDKAFQSSALSSLTFNNKTSYIGQNAFEGTQITELVIPQYINDKGETANLNLRDEAFYGTRKLETARILSSIEYDGDANVLAPAVFRRSTLTKIELPASLTVIGGHAFEESGLTEFTGGANLTKMGEYTGYVFADCKDLKTVDLSKTKLIRIDEYQFYKTPALETLSLPATMDLIRSDAFNEAGLKEFEAYASHIEENAFVDMPNLEKIRFTHPEYTTMISHTLYDCPKLTEVDFGAVKSISADAIYFCKSYTRLVIGKNVESMDKKAFDNIKGQLESVTVKSNSLDAIADPADAALDGASVDIFFDEAVKTIPANVFAGIKLLHSPELRADLAIDKAAFSNAVIDSLDWHYGDDVAFPFFNGAEVVKLTFSKITEIGKSLFANAYIDNLYLDGIETIGEKAFFKSSLTNSGNRMTLVIPASVKEIGESAFEEVISDNLLIEQGSGLTLGAKAFARPSDAFHTITTRYPKESIPAAEDNTFEADWKTDRVYAGTCESVEAYQAAKGWKDIKTSTWDGITGYKYSFEIVGETTKRPIEAYNDAISLNGKYIASETYIGCDNKAEINFTSPCTAIEFDHWADGTKDAMKGTVMTLTSDTVIRIWVKETSHKLELAVKNPAMADKVRFKMFSPTTGEWTEQSEAEFNDCDYTDLSAIYVELLDPMHYWFNGWLKEDDSKYSDDQEASAPSSTMKLFADIHVNEYTILSEMMPGMDPNYDLVDHLELNGTDMDKNIVESVPYGSEVTLEAVGVKGSDYRYVLDYWQDDTYAEVSKDNPWVFNMPDHEVRVTPVMKLAGAFTVTAKSDNSTLGTVSMNFDADDKAGDKLYEGAKVHLEATPEAHCKFVKWNDNAGYESTKDIRDVYVKGDFDYVATFEKDSFDITVVIDGLADPSVVEVTGAGRYGWGDLVMLKYTIKDSHFHFVEWTYGGSHTTASDFEFKAEKDLEVTAVFEADEYTVEAVAVPAEYGTVSGGATAAYGTELTLKAEPAEGCMFTGWEDDGEAGAERKVTVTDNFTYRAFFAPIQYMVDFIDWNGASVGGDLVNVGKTVTAPEDPEREGYDFLGWRLGEKVYSADEINALPVTAAVTYNAEYKIKTFTVRFFDHDGNQIGEAQTVKWNEAAVAPEAPAWDGHTFSCWDNDFQHVKADMDIKPVYDTETFTVRFEDYNGDLISEQKVVKGKGAVEPDDPVREGFVFTGWDKAFDYIIADLTVIAQYDKEDKYVPENLTVTLTPSGSDLQIILSWDKVDGAASYELLVTCEEKEILRTNTYGQNSITRLLSLLKEEYSLAPGTYTIDWSVRSLDKDENVISVWAKGKSFDLTVKDTSTNLGDMQEDGIKTTKVLINGSLYIIMSTADSSRMYDIQGREAK